MCLCTVDYYSKWIDIDILPSESSKATIAILKQHFTCYGIPDEVISDNGPQFSSNGFAELNHTTRSLHYPQVNGQVERTVQTVKDLMTKSKDINKAFITLSKHPFRHDETILSSGGDGTTVIDNITNNN